MVIEAHDFLKGPLKMMIPRKVYHRDSDDATHSHQFHQIEGIVVDENITMSNLRGTLEFISKKNLDRTEKSVSAQKLNSLFLQYLFNCILVQVKSSKT